MAKPAKKIILSILILSLPERHRLFHRLVSKLESQARGRIDVEILALLDNQSLSISEKRNALLGMARGTHLAFIDDDDDVSHDYVQKILTALEEHPQVDSLCFHQIFRLNGRLGRTLSSMKFEEDPPLKVLSVWRFADLRRKPFHWCVWRSEIAKSELFRESRDEVTGQSCEDIDWLRRLYPKVATSVALDAFLHFYVYDDYKTRSKLAESKVRSLRDWMVLSVRRLFPQAWLLKVPTDEASI